MVTATSDARQSEAPQADAAPPQPADFARTVEIGDGPLLNIAEAVIAGHALTAGDALALLSLPANRLHDLMYAAHTVKRHFLGDSLHRCSIVNAKSGGCGEDCGFCAQSAHFETGAESYTLLGVDKILRAADFARQAGSTNFGIVTALRAIRKGPMLDQICEAIRELRKRGEILPDASLGTVGREELDQLREAGLEVYHHNLECSKSYYPTVTSTRRWQDNWNTCVWTKEAGLKLCSGGIFGMGESPVQQIELLSELRELEPANVPINFLVPMPGTPLENEGRLTPTECLAIIAVARLMLPRQDIFIAGGRVQHLRQLQPMLFFAGASGMMVGNYLTTPGRTKRDDIELLRDMELIGADEANELLRPVPVNAAPAQVPAAQPAAAAAGAAQPGACS